jgi:uracil phosphoribosyltransferase
LPLAANPMATKKFKDQQNFKGEYLPQQLKHHYGPQVHILYNPYLRSLLARFSTPQIGQPLLNTYLEILYTHLLGEALGSLAPQIQVHWPTRMREFHQEAIFEGNVVHEQLPVVCVALARAGTWPSHICFHQLHHYFAPSFLRQDHIYIGRKADESGHVTGVDLYGSKIGGGQEKALVLFPDPMGATGRSMSEVVGYYKENVSGKALRYVAMHLIVTSEYIQFMHDRHPDLEIFAYRVDRGLSSEKILQSELGQYPKEEKGLNERQYIVPGAGGVGEIINNSFV